MTTKAARLEEVRSILSKYQTHLDEEPVLSDEDRYRFSKAVGYYFSGVKCLRNPAYPNQLNFINVKNDHEDAWTTFSWNGAIKGNRVGINLHGLRNAMRNAIQPQIFKYLNSVSSLNCVLCGSDDHPSVDHVGHSFHSISEVFREDWGDYIELMNNQDGVGWSFKSPEIEAKWEEFHEGCAEYRILCRSCNSKLGKDSK